MTIINKSLFAKGIHMKRLVINPLLCIIGAALFSVSVNMFCLPNKILQGGVTGIAMVINNFLPGIDVGLSVFVLNIPLFILAAHHLNRSFAVKSLAVTFMFSVMLDLGAVFVVPYTQNRLLGCIFGGVVSGIGMGLIFLSGATTGGVDIIAMIIRKYRPEASVGRIILLMDFVVVLLCFFVYGNIESVMYSLVTVFLTSRGIDTVISGRDYRKLVLIITDNPEGISDSISQGTGRGVTFIDAVGAYSRKGKKMLICACNVAQSRQITRIVCDYDKNAFTVIMNVSEIIGEGFRNIK